MSESSFHVLLDRRLRFEEGVIRCSEILLGDQPHALTLILQVLREVTEVSRVYVFSNAHDEDRRLCMSQIAEVCAPGVTPELPNSELQMLPYAEGFERWRQALSLGDRICGVVEEFPSSEQPILREQGILSLLVLPYFVHGEWRGFFGFDDTIMRRSWQDEDIGLLRAVTHMWGTYRTRNELVQVLQATERTNRAIVSESPDAIVIVDRVGNLQSWNPAAEALFGIPAERAIGRRFSEIVEEMGLESAVRPEAFEALMTGEPNERARRLLSSPIEFEAARDDGTSRHLQMRLFLSEIDGEKVLGAIVRDLTERAALEADLTQQNRRYDLATRSGRVGVFEWNLVTGEFYLDPTVKRMLGYNDDEIPNDLERWSSHVHPDDRSMVMDRATDHIEGRLPVYDCEHRMIAKDGSVRWIHVRGVVERNEDTGEARMFGTDVDITERKEADLELSDSLAQKERLLRETNHRVKNNLNMLTSLIHLESRRADTAASKKLCDNLIGRIQSIATVHEKLYKTGNVQGILFSEYVEVLMAHLMNVLASEQVDIRYEVACGDSVFDSDRLVPLGLIVTELVTNAVKYAFVGRKEGHISVELELKGADYILTVADDGVGVDLDPDVDLLAGNSLGLTLVHSLAEQLAGTLGWERDNGTRFQVVFPVNRDSGRSGAR